MCQAGRAGGHLQRLVARLSEVALRPARQEDCAALSRLIAQLGYDAELGDVAVRLAAMEAEGRVVLVAEIDGRVVGCLSTSVMQVLHRPAPVGRISMMVVDEALRGQGIGARLVAAAERHLLAQGCRIVEVTSHVSRERAHAFYEALGYEKTSVRLAREP
ncbi:GNAT family N-acetyltransferase [Tsuneonella sp. HG222]